MEAAATAMTLLVVGFLFLDAIMIVQAWGKKKGRDNVLVPTQPKLQRKTEK